MNFSPQKFFIGLVGFFSVIMPGALLAYLGRDWIEETFLTPSFYGSEGWEEALVFLFAAYLLGHFAFLLGSTLDDLVYAPLRGATRAGQVERLANGKGLTHPRLRRAALSPWVFGSNADAAVLMGQRLRSAALAPMGAERAVNAYQWAKVRLSREHPAGLLTVERFEADSKFFRSFCVVLLFLVPVFLWQLRPLAALVCALLVAPALWRYVDQRFKATQQAYWHLIALERERRESEGPDSDEPRRVRSPEGLTHAGGVVYRPGAAGAEYLLVETSAGGEWVLPKGHIEPFEPLPETAVREVHEESGVWARVIVSVADVDLFAKGEQIAIRFYLMEALEQEAATGEGRRQRWLLFGDAIAAATHEETRQLLAAADRLRTQRGFTAKDAKN
jgi:8-oxo-dGTP pyrophosphatase MutT (NUDIX family)